MSDGEQFDLFSWGRPQTEQERQVQRVAGHIGPAVLSFCRRVGQDGEFHAQTLHDYVGREVAPASADRILRHLRGIGIIDYVVINRRASFYRITRIEP